ncbi:hypothetical protein L914_00924 [Phytophthora nicotianae]|uniref:Uncharacterized protein n=1 Tax=Phytophthora nicotianae TaxID=4792 RepID=W2P5H4_PHYNI|nr:hypothetical protein L914_00924 [Phytophthora nicotianae]
MSSFTCQDYSSPDTTAPITKKRRPSPPTNDTNVNIIEKENRPRGSLRGKKAKPSARDEIGMLKAQVTSLEEQLRHLRTKWSRYLPDERTLTIAQHSAHMKYEIRQTLTEQKQLQELFQQQQIAFAKLQSVVLRAPVYSNGDKIFKALHFDTRLGHDPEDRRNTLKAHNEHSLATIPSIMDQLTQSTVDKLLQYQGKDAIKTPVLPISHIDVTGCADYTLVTSVFMSEIPHPSLQDVYAGVLAFFGSISLSLKHHFGMNATQTKLNSEESPVYWRMGYENAGGLPATANQVMCSELTTTHATVHLDTITDDPLHPSNSIEFGNCGLTLTPRIESATDKTVSVMLRWAVVYRYDILPDHPILQKHVEMIRPILNGDLITASLCNYIQKLLRERSDPFVEVIRFGMTHRNVGWHTQGDVEQIQDQYIHKNVFKIRGAIAATNYLRVPRDAVKGTHGLGLTGRYAYLQVRRIGDLPMTIHLDFVTNKKTALRFTLSSIYQLFRSTGTVLRVPLSFDTRWTVVVVDMVRLLELHSFNQYARETYRHLKTITLCASMNVRNFFVSPTLYTPTTLPSSLRFPGDFGDQYGWVILPDGGSSVDHEIHQHCKQEDLRIAATPTPVQVRRNLNGSACSINNEGEAEEYSSINEAQVEVITKLSPRTRDANIRRDRNDILSKADQILRDAGVFVNAESANNRESIDAGYQSPLSSPTMKFASGMKQGLRTRIVSSSTKAEWPDPILELDRIIGFSNNFAHMLLWAPDGSACIYTSASTIIYREFCDERRTKNATNGADENIRSTEAVKGSTEASGSATTTREYFLYGHCAAICALAVTNDGSLLASAEVPKESNQNGIRLWNLTNHDCITVIKAQPKGVHALCFSPLSKSRLLLCVVGRDECFRTQIFIWDCSSLQRGKLDPLSTAVSLMARQTSDFPIDRMSFSPYEHRDQFHLVSCGRENIRYWRVNPNTGHLTGCPVILNEYSRGTVFTDIGFDTIVDSHPSNIHRVCPLYVSSSVGTLLVIDYDSKQVICVYQLHDASINCLSVNEGFCVTGSDDCFLRVWPLDFTDFFLEAQHEAGVSCLDVSSDGMKVLVGSRNNAVGVLDIASQHYATLLRSHTKKVTAMAAAPWGSPLASLLLEDTGVGTESELVTASEDGTLRVWDTSSGHQLYEFDIQLERVVSLAASPVNSGIVAVGFASGYTRIFDVHRTSQATDNDEVLSSMLHEFRQHQSSIRHIAFDTDAQHLFTSGSGKQLCLYDARQQDYLPLKMLLADFDHEDGRFEVSFDKKWLALVSSDRQSIAMLDPCSLRVISTVRPPNQGQEETLKLARFSNHSSELLVLSASDRLHIFSLPGREYVQSMPLLGQDGISALVMSANAKYMATGGADGSLRVWNWDERGRIGRMHQSFLGHAGKVNELAFTKDGKGLVASGESSAICIWQFHGDSSPMSPREKSGPLDRKCFNLAGLEESDDMNVDHDGHMHGDSSSTNGTSSKTNFRLSLEDDALTLNSGSETVQRGRFDSVLSNGADLQDIDIPTTVVETMTVCGELSLSNAVGGFNPSKFIWSYSTGKLLSAAGSVLVVEDLASGEQQFHGDFSNNKTDSLDEIVVVQLSPSGENMAMISSRFDVVVIRSLTRTDEDNTSTKNVISSQQDDPILITLLPDTRAVTCLAFAQCAGYGTSDQRICMACKIGKMPQNVVVVASTTQKCIIWSSLNSSGIQQAEIRQILATSDSQFLLLHVSDDYSGARTLSIHRDEATGASGKVPEATIESLIGIFPTQVQLISLFNTKGRTDRLRYLVGIDNDRYCYFYDLHRNTFIASTQLLLLPSKSKSGNNQVDDNGKRVSTSRKLVEFLEWVTTAGKSLLISGSTTENVLYVHGLPMLSTKHSARIQVDWQRMARAGVSLLCKISLSGGGLLRSLSVDPARDVGIATTDDGTTLLAHFDASSTTRVIREAAVGNPFVAASASWALEGAVMLSISQNDNAIRVWLPELAKEIATFQVDSAVCTSFAVNPFSSLHDIPQSMVMAGYSDRSFRIFDLCEMRLLSRFELTSSSGKASRYEGSFIDRIVFVGPFNALVVTKDNCVLLVDISNALEGTEEAQSTRQSNVRTPPKRSISRPAKKSLQERPRTRLKLSIPGGRKTDREVVYRELVLLPSSYIRRKRLPGLAKSEQVHVEVGAIEVKESREANIHPFLIVVKYTGPARYGDGRCMVKVFADPATNVSNEEEIAPTDEWRLNIRPCLDQSVATFMEIESGSVQVLYAYKTQHTDHSSSGRCQWGLELRDCVQQCAIQRFRFTTSLSNPVMLRSINAMLLNESEAAELLLVDAEGRMAVFEVANRRLHPVNAQTSQRLQLKPCSIVKRAVLLTSPTQLAVASLNFH